MQYNAVDSNNVLNPILTSGITPEMDTKLSVSRLVKTAKHQKGFVEDYVMALGKFTMFYIV